ncbi:Talin-1 [Branchiostoma belcheri]|nr:Talin-1 [Branchiostoma belcheri]
MASLSLKISVKHANVVKTMQFEPSTIVYDACRMIRERIPEAQMGNATEFGMFLADEDPKKGVWLEAGRTLDYYLLRSGDLLEYKKKHRPLKVRMLDGTVKTVMVDDSHTVAQLLVTICTRIGITNHDEYSLVREGEKIREAAEPPTPVKKVGGISDRTLMRDEKKMEALKKKLHTDDELNWLDHGRTLREQGIDDTETLLLRRKFFYSDQNVDSRDPVQLNLLYVQARDGILNGTHPVTVDEAMMFAAYQTQIQFGDHIETKHKSGFLDLKEFLPKEYVKNKGIEKKIWLEHRKLAGLTELDAKVRYTQQCRSLKTYGVTFFLVKEKMKGKNKLVPRLLGITKDSEKMKGKNKLVPRLLGITKDSEKMKGKNKLVPRLLGITKDSVMRVDEKTKEILKVWPLTTVRRWAASPKSFTLDFGDYSESYYSDFGDYSESYYSVQTTEGETISQLIAGYIDIILRKKKGKDRFGLDGEEESTMLEDSVSPARATIMQHQENKVGHVNEGSVAIPAVMRAHDVSLLLSPQPIGAESYSTGTMPRAEYATIRGQIHSAHMPPINTQAQQALMGNISSGFNSISAAQAELGSRAELPPLGSDPASLKWKQNTLDVSKQNVTSQLAAMSAATASVVTLTSGEPEQTDYTAVGSAVTTISSNLTEMSKGIKMVAALLEDYGQGERLLDAARNLAGAFSDLLSAAKPGSTEPRQNLLTAAGNIGEHGREVLHEMGEVDTDPRFQDALMALAKAVANATATLVLKAKNVASKAEDPAMQNKVIASATQTALSTSQLVACTKVVAPTISHPACQEQLIDAAKLVAKSVEKTVDSAQMATQEEFLLKDLGAAATQVTQALNELLQHIKLASKAKGGEQYEDHCDTIISASDRLFASMGNASDMIKQAKILAEATSHLVNSIKSSADTTDDTDSQKRLLGAAKVLADATARMVEAAKGCAVNPHDSDEQENLRKAAEDLRAATNAAAGNAIKKKLVSKLETTEETVTVQTMVKLTHYDKDQLKKILEELQNAAKHAAAVATQTIAASQAAASSNKNPASQQQLVTSCKHVADHIPRLVQGVRGSRAQPDSPSAQLLLINASQEFISPANNMNSAAKAAVPTVSDQAASMQLSNCSKQLAQALAELRSAAQKAQDACGPLEIDSALDTIRQLDSDLVEIKKSAAQGQLVPLPDESGEQCAQELGHTSKTVGASMAQLLTAAAQGNENYTGLAARDTANALRTLTGAVRGVAAATSDRQAQDHLIDTARDVMDKSVNLIEEAKKAVNDPNNPDNQQRLAQVAKAVSHALNNCVNCLPGQRDVDFAIRNIGEASKALLSGQLQKGDVSFQEVQTMLSTAAQELNMASSELVVASKGTHEQLAQASGKFSKDFSMLLEAGMQMAAQTSDEEQQSLMVSNLKSISMSSSKLLLAAKSLSADPNAPNAKNQLASAARSVTDSINQLINICMQTAPGQKECDNALRNIETVTEITEVHSSSSSSAVVSTETRKVSELKKDMEMHIVLPHPDIITKSVEVYISHFNSQTRVMRSMLDNPMEPVNDLTYFDCLETVMDKSKTLGESMSSITQHAKNSEHEEFGSAVTRASTAVCGLTEAAAQTAYLVGIADPSSQAGRQGLVDQSQFARANQAIQMACQQLLDPTTSQAQVLSAATVIAKHTSSLCNMCRVASTKTSNPVAKRHFVQSAKEVANSTANLVKSIKALDGNFTEQNRQQVAEASRPLMEAVENLTTFASNPEFASVPAQISIEARKAQEPIVIAGRTIIDSTSSLITTAKLLAVNPKDPPTWQLLAGHSKTVSDSIKRLIASIRDKAPGQRECDRGIEVINQCIRDVDQASLSAVTQKLEARNEGTTQTFQEQMNNAAHEIGKNIDGVASAAKEKAEKLGHQVTQLSSYFDPLASAAINLASKTMNSQKQANLLEQTKTVAESALQLVYTSKEGGGNPKATHAHAAIDEAAEGMKEAVDDLLKTLDESASETGAVFGMVDGITKAMTDMVDGRLEDKPDGTFVDYQTKMVKIAKQIARTSHDMVGKASSSPEELGPQANSLSHDFSELAVQSKGAMATINSPELSDRIRNSVQDLGNSCVDVVNNAGAIQSNPSDTYAKKDLIENSRAVSEKVSFVLASLQAGSRGTQACINAASTVSGIIGDLDTTIMFASAGTLSPEMEDEAFADHRENILKTAKALVEDTKTLVSGAASSQEHLAAAAQSAVDTITKLADAVKSGAASLGPQDAEAQVLLINAVKDVAVALGELIEATKNASGKPVQDPSMVQLKNSAKQLLQDIHSQYIVTKPNQPRWENYINSLAKEQTKKTSSRTYVTKTSTSQLVTTKHKPKATCDSSDIEAQDKKKAGRTQVSVQRQPSPSYTYSDVSDTEGQDKKKAGRTQASLLPPPKPVRRLPSPSYVYSDASDTERTETPVHELSEEPSENVFDIVKRFEQAEMRRLYIEEGRDSPTIRHRSPSPRSESPLVNRRAKSPSLRATEAQSPITYVVERVISPTLDKSPEEDSLKTSQVPTRALRPKSPTPESQPALIPGRKSPVPGRKSPLLGSQSPVPGKRSPLLGTHSPVPGRKSPLFGTQSPVPGKKSPIPGRLSPGDRPRSPYLNVVHSWRVSEPEERTEKKVQFTKVVVRESTDRELEKKLRKRREIADSTIVGEQPTEMEIVGDEDGRWIVEEITDAGSPGGEAEVYGNQFMVRSREAHKVSMEEAVQQEPSSSSSASPVVHPPPEDAQAISQGYLATVSMETSPPLPVSHPSGHLATVAMETPPPLPAPPVSHPSGNLATVSMETPPPLPEPPVCHSPDHLATVSEPPLPEPPFIHPHDHLATASEPHPSPPLPEPPVKIEQVTKEVKTSQIIETSTELIPPPDVIEIQERKQEETCSIRTTASSQMETVVTVTTTSETAEDADSTAERSSYIGFDSPVPEEMAEEKIPEKEKTMGVSPESLAKIAADKIQESELEESESDTDIEMCYDVTPGGLETIYELSDEQEDPHSMEFENALENVQFDEESGRWFAATGMKPVLAGKVIVRKKKILEEVKVKEEIKEESKVKVCRQRH